MENDPADLLEGERDNLRDEIKEILSSPGAWMTEKHAMLGGRSPEECIRDGDKQLVRDLVRSIKYVGVI